MMRRRCNRGTCHFLRLNSECWVLPNSAGWTRCGRWPSSLWRPPHGVRRFCR